MRNSAASFGVAQCDMPTNGRRRARRWLRIMIWSCVALLACTLALGVVVPMHAGCRFPESRSAETWARTIRAATLNWQAVSGSDRCPTIAQLITEKHLDPGTSSVDPWGRPFILSCTPDEIFVTSSGADKRLGTADDIRIPRVASGARLGKLSD